MEDGGAYCYSDDSCRELLKTAPYFASSSDQFHPPQLKGYGLFSDDSSISPFAEANVVYIPYCSSDAWLFDELKLLSGQFYVRGAIILQSILRELFSGAAVSQTKLVLVGSSAGAVGVFNHVSFVVQTLGFPSANVQMILDSWSVPLPVFEYNEVSVPMPSRSWSDGRQLTFSVVLQALKAVLQQRSHWTANTSSTVWLKNMPCAVSFDCMADNGFVPAGVKTLVISSTYDSVLYTFSEDLAQTTTMATLVTNFFAQAGAISQSLVNAYYRNDHTTVFAAGCMNHLYISPVDPAYRAIQRTWSQSDIDRHIAGAAQRGQVTVDVRDGVAVATSAYGPFRWFAANFGASQFTKQYAAGQSLGAMVATWVHSTRSDIVGTLCLDRPGCEATCSDEHVDVATPDTDAALFVAAMAVFGGAVVAIAASVVFLSFADQASPRPAKAAARSAQEETGLPFNLDDFKVQKLMMHNHRRSRQLAAVGKATGTTSTLLMSLASEEAKAAPFLAVEQQLSGDDWEKRRADATRTLAVRLPALLRRWRKNWAMEEAQNKASLQGHLKRCDGSVAVSWAAVNYQPSAQGPALLNNAWGHFRFGRLTCILGSSGSGKTSLLMLLAGKKNEGQFRGIVQQHALLSCRRLLTGRDVSFVNQHESGAFPRLTVEENFYFRLKLAKKTLLGDEAAWQRDIDELLDRTGLRQQRSSLVETLSGGQLKRIGIGLQLVMNDPVIFLDEPTSGLDGTSSLEIMTMLKTEASTFGKCVVAVVHQPRNEIFELVDELLVLKAGRTMYCGSCHSFLQDVLPYLAPIDTDSTGDRIIDHITHYDDFDVPRASDGSDAAELPFQSPNSISSKFFEHSMWTKRLRSQRLHEAAPRPAVAFHAPSMSPRGSVSGRLTASGPQRFSPSDVFQLAHALFSSRAKSRAQRKFVALWDELHLMDACQAPSIGGLQAKVQSLGIRLQPLTFAMEASLWRQKAAELTASASVMGLLVQRLYRSLGQLRGVLRTSSTTLLVYPLVGMFFLRALSWFDVISTSLIVGLVPVFMALLTLSVDINVNMQLVFLELRDGIFSYTELLVAFLWTFSFSAMCIQVLGVFAVLMVRADTSAVELLSIAVFLCLAAVFTVALMVMVAVLTGFGAHTSTVSDCSSVGWPPPPPVSFAFDVRLSVCVS